VDDRLGNKIRKYQTSKVKTQLVIGDKEVENKNISLRFYGEEKQKTFSKEELLKVYKDKIN
jgi:threonyl-tRNA synthetase